MTSPQRATSPVWVRTKLNTNVSSFHFHRVYGSHVGVVFFPEADRRRVKLALSPIAHLQEL